MKTLKLFIFLSGVFFGTSYSQIDPCQFPNNPVAANLYEEILKESPFVFEGVILDTMYYNGATGKTNDLYLEMDATGNKIVHSCTPLTSHKIKITHVFRGIGLLKEGTIDLVIEGGIYWDNGIKIESYWDKSFRAMPVGTKGIFFCEKFPKKSWWKPSPLQTDNEIRVVPVEIGGPGVDGAIHIFDRVFLSYKEFYQFLSRYPNITIPKEEEK